jgi:hypothetical protein
MDITSFFRRPRAPLHGTAPRAAAPLAAFTLLSLLIVPTSSLGQSASLSPLPRPASQVPVSQAPVSIAEPSPPACMRVIWAPPTSEICGAKWGVQAAAGSHNTEAEDRRYSCATIDGETALALKSWGDKPNSLVEFSRAETGGGDVARLTAQILIPEDYELYENGRLAFGLLIGDRKCASGGCLPEEQTGAMIRANFATSKDGKSIVLADYSYHLDRRTKARVTNPQWEGRSRALRAFGAGRAMDRALPKGEWVTLELDVVLNTPGKADGSSRLSAYDSKGRLIDSAGYDDVTYRPDASWTITGPVMTEKYNDSRPGPKDQTIYYRDFQLASGSREACGE